MDLRHKILLSIYLVLFPVLIIAGALIYLRDYRAIMEENVNRYQSAIRRVDDSTAYLLRDMSDISVYFCVNADIIRILSMSSPQNADPLFWTREAPTRFIRDILAIKSHIRTLALYPENGLSAFYVSRDASVHNPQVDGIRRLPLYNAALAARGDIILERINAGETGLFLRNTGNKIIAAREIFDLSKQRRLGFLVLGMDVSWIETIYNNVIIEKNETIVMVSDGKAIVQSAPPDPAVSGFILSGESAGPFNRRGNWYIFRSGRNTAEQHYYISPKSNWDARIRRGLILPALLALALLVSSWPLSTLSSRIISRPLSRLYQSMNRFREGNFNERIDAAGNDEIAELSAMFNRMVTEIRDLIDRNYLIVLREKESELNALQAQINPHFLYNVLDSLYWQAQDSGQEKLAEDILSLSDLFRLLLSSGRSEISVEQEVKLITSYLRIQKMRFYRRLDYRIEVDKAIYSSAIPKLILQPFVENAIVHGLERNDSPGLVEIRGTREEGMIRFTITDNGAGMEAEKLNAILDGADTPGNGETAKAQRVSYYAIRNVKERMALRYGAAGKLRIESRTGAGTRVEITIPQTGEVHG
ncbi:MAG: sensor histidine kinase [Treponema sp.]|jgi:two-component system sensor histidine kinase YesM|nr:sensor histidine kinase [Treponema sp.]